MIVIICAKYKKNPSRTVDATERTRFSKSRPNDLEDIGQGQRSSHATHPLMLLTICTKYGKNPSWTVDATGRTRKGNRQTDGQTGWIQYTPPNFVAGGIKNNRSRTENVTERTRFLMSRSNDLEDTGHGQRSSHATHPLMVVIICGKYGNNRSRTENITERTRFSKSRSSDLEDIAQGQRSSHATHLLMLVIICTKYGKNPSRTVDATERTWFSRPWPNDHEDIGQGQRVIICNTPSHTSDHLC